MQVLLNYIDLTKRRILMSAFFEFQFHYCLVIRMFHSRLLNNKIIRKHKTYLTIIHNKKKSNFEDLLVSTSTSNATHHTSLSVNGVRLHSQAPTHVCIYLGVLLLHLRNFIWRVNRTLTLQQVCSVINLQIIHLQLLVKLSFCS